MQNAIKSGLKYDFQIAANAVVQEISKKAGINLGALPAVLTTVRSYRDPDRTINNN